MQNDEIHKFFDNIDDFDKNLTISELENIYNYVLARFLTQNLFPNGTTTLLSKIDSRFGYAIMLNLKSVSTALQIKQVNEALRFADNVLLSKETPNEIKIGCIMYFYRADHKSEIKSKLNILMQNDENN